MTSQRRRVGRPRHIAYGGDVSPRDQILDAAARLFVERSFAATSTREIADAVGIRQASLYYHFANKDEILAELLKRSVRPTVDKIAKIEQLVPPETHETALYLLALVDVRTLATARHNIGVLSRLPDVTNSSAFAEFRNDRAELVEAYGRLGASIAPATIVDLVGQKRLGEMLVQVVDTVINIRSGGDPAGPRTAEAVATTCLRICGSDDSKILAASAAATRLLEAFHDEPLH